MSRGGPEVWLLTPTSRLTRQTIERILDALLASGFTFDEEHEDFNNFSMTTPAGGEIESTVSLLDALSAFDSSEFWGVYLGNEWSDPGIGLGGCFLAIDRSAALSVPDVSCLSLSLTFSPDPQREVFLYHQFRAWVGLVSGLAHPDYGWGGLSEFGVHLFASDEKDSVPFVAARVARRERQRIEWLNIFGQPYVELLGRDRLLATPAWKVDVLPDGGIAVALAPHPRAVSQETAARISIHLGLPVPHP